ncbi:MAG: hypothetical protein ACRDBM_07325, partial [Sporomusa sp.]
AGVLTGTIAGYVLFSLLADTLQQKTAIAVTASFSVTELYTLTAILVAGITASIIPALHSATTSITNYND